MRAPLLSLLALLTLVRCSDAPSDGPGEDAPVERAPKAIPLDGDPNGLFWDAESETLYIADDQHHRLLKYRDGEGVSLAVAPPDAPPNSTHLGEDPGRRSSWLALARATVSVP
ncbi:hypothetical protein QEG98_15255 [Myxococcus sp. MxC21-1]|uniref:hypothetical protein n=1 Tax=Myxococcus sp. MxC21-1 TaxID=3041439 RepID=UPI00292FF058|nr:hypothetical protein [Myxococcus sp. MxC21-1]WNZ64882.1 hypothetical protein QEG98_15255 [Myxococcus sp. MxC21-1]